MTQTSSAAQIGEKIRQARTEHGLSLRQLADKSGVPPASIARIETGIVQQPKATALHALAVALEIAPSDLYLLAQHSLPEDLPTFEHYLTARYPELTQASIVELEILLHSLIEKEQRTHPERRESMSTDNTNSRAIVFTVAETARRLKVSPWLIHKLIREQELPSVRVGRRLLITAHDIDRYIERSRAGSRGGRAYGA